MPRGWLFVDASSPLALGAEVSVEPHSRGGFAVVIETVESLPRDFDDYFERSELMLVI